MYIWLLWIKLSGRTDSNLYCWYERATLPKWWNKLQESTDLEVWV